MCCAAQWFPSCEINNIHEHFVVAGFIPSTMRHTSVTLGISAK